MVVPYVHLDEDEGGEVKTKNVSQYHSRGDSESTVEEHLTVKREKYGARLLMDEREIVSLRRRPIHSKIQEGDTSLHSSKRSTEFWSQPIWMPRAKSDPALPSVTGAKGVNRLDCMNDGLKRFLWTVVLLIVVILFVLVMRVTNNTDMVMEKDFSTLMEDVKSAYPSQQEQLWKKSLIHLQQNLRATKPTGPVNMILTAGWSAERTLHCLAGHLAAAFSSGTNASVLHIDGTSWSSLDSDEAKLAIDHKLTGAFESKRMAAVVHRFEELPPGSALIFYRYCDHENAVYKGVLLVFTVLLPVEVLDPTLSLVAVEEMVRDHIQSRFLPSALPGTFNQMDLDKFGGLWSRIAHLVLPVVAEEQMEKNGCNN
ncbi:torsin-1A-interacting protein 2-like [Scleropages formosus]|nr:torsin-1A-interacting protein 2-like [Scleropages formosus]